MKTTEVTLRFLEPDEGYVLRSKTDNTIFSDRVSLSVHDTAENWEEVDSKTAEQEQERIRRENEEKLNMEVE